ncbi:quinoprotein relay system zinc metallohydrolase 2 [Paracoccus sp. M683]|uniref:quinoprotein relay system zinc metallohydrolase 2 n=1 Tax=Paracoccus sp. M683 TaxID=2594268 RepID=UPI00117C9FCD|nr:quinoprotein relay system zinc metallohydrolase 2 [Paracoccus sp. M683]TRW98750.1 quinoprotein relay system zinc metallohydrolase 2 [Paracoccus sp. M683]
MFHLILTACLATSSGICGPILLPQGDAATQQDCEARAARITDDWIAAQPGLTAAGTRCRANADVAALQLQTIAPGIWFRRGDIAQIETGNRGRIANLSVVIGETGVAVIDAGASRGEGQELYAAIRQLTDRPITHVILTHMHPDHVFGASVFSEAGATVLASDRLGPALQARAQSYLDSFDRIVGPTEMIGTAIAMPDTVVSDRMTIGLGGRKLELLAVPTAHTDNDLTVRDVATNTLFTGDLVFRGLTPAVDGSINGWLQWLESPPKDVALVVPGHGETAQGWDEAVAKQANLLVQLRDSVRNAIASGKPMSQAVPDIVEELHGFAEGWTDFPDTIARDATAAFKELEWE